MGLAATLILALLENAPTIIAGVKSGVVAVEDAIAVFDCVKAAVTPPMQATVAKPEAPPEVEPAAYDAAMALLRQYGPNRTEG